MRCASGLFAWSRNEFDSGWENRSTRTEMGAGRDLSWHAGSLAKAGLLAARADPFERGNRVGGGERFLRRRRTPRVGPCGVKKGNEEGGRAVLPVDMFRIVETAKSSISRNGARGWDAEFVAERDSVAGISSRRRRGCADPGRQREIEGG